MRYENNETPPRFTIRGDRGAAVADMQRYLLRWGGEPERIIWKTSIRGSGNIDEWDVDGIHGADTDRAIAAWHAERGFAPEPSATGAEHSVPNENITPVIYSANTQPREVPAELNNVAGIDVSHWQDPALMQWDLLCKDYAFCIARACYGTSADRHFAAHVAAARAADVRVGAYLFFRQTQTPDEQLRALVDQLDAVGLGPGDVVPAIDLEHNDSGADGKVSPLLHNAGGEWLADELAALYGDCLVYMSPSHYLRIGKPQWLQRFSPWVAHYTAAAEPAWRDPWPEWSVWQKSGSHRHAGFSGGKGDLDLNFAKRLPLVG